MLGNKDYRVFYFVTTGKLEKLKIEVENIEGFFCNKTKNETKSEKDKKATSLLILITA